MLLGLDVDEYKFTLRKTRTYEIIEDVKNLRSELGIIYVSDRATLFNLLIGLNGYTICSGILSSDLNGSNIISIPLMTDEQRGMIPASMGTWIPTIAALWRNE